MDSELTSSLLQIVFSNEAIAFIKHITKGISFHQEELAMDIIADVGAGGNYLSHEKVYEDIYAHLLTRLPIVNGREMAQRI